MTIEKNYLDGSEDRVNEIGVKAYNEAMYPGDCPPAMAAGVGAMSAGIYAFGLWFVENESVDRDAKVLMMLALRDFASTQMESEVMFAAFDAWLEAASKAE